MGNALDDFKMMLEHREPGKTTRREYALRDIQNIMQAQPGAIGRGVIDQEVELSSEPVQIGTIPSGAKILAASLHVVEQPTTDLESISLGTEDEPNHYGTTEKCSETGDQKCFKNWHKDDEPMEETPVFVTVNGLPEPGEEEDQEQPGGKVRAVITYEKLNDFED